MTHRCPECNQIVRENGQREAVRVCYDCGQVIGRHHKYTMRTMGSGMTVLVHRVCSNPDSYCRAAVNAKIGVIGYKGLSREKVAELTARENELEAGFAAWRKENGR